MITKDAPVIKEDIEKYKKNSDFYSLNDREKNAKKIIKLLETDMNNSRILYKSLLNYSVKIVENYHDGEDILSQFILNLIERGALTYKYDINDSIDINLKRWLSRGIRNLSTSFLRNKKIRNMHSFPGDEEEDYKFTDTYWQKQKQEETPCDKATKKEIIEICSRNVSNLKKEYRDILMQRFSNRSSYKQISEVLNLKMGTVKSRLHKAKQEFAGIEEIADLPSN